MLPPAETSKSGNSEIGTLLSMGFTDILDGSFSLYRRYFRVFAQIAAINIFAELIPQVLLDFMPQDSIALAVAIITNRPLFLVSIGGIVVATALHYSEEPITTRSALKHVGKRFFPLLACAALWLLAITVLSITIIGIPLAIYFAVCWAFFVETLLLEGISVRDALRRSSELVSGRWWQVCGMLLAVYLISVAIHAVLEISVGIILVVSGVASEVDLIDIIEWATIGGFSAVFLPNNNLGLYILMTGIHLVISVISFPIWVIGVTLLYLNQRIQRERFDINEIRENLSRNLATKYKI